MKARREGVRGQSPTSACSDVEHKRNESPAAKRGQIGAIFGEKFYRFSFG